MSYKFDRILDTIKLNKCKKGSCVAFVELANEALKDSGEEYYIVEGYVKFTDEEDRDSGKMQHSWIEKEGMIYDPTLIQFNGWDLSTVKYFIKKKYTPEEYSELTKKYPLENMKQYIPESKSYLITEKLSSTIAMYMVVKRLLTPWHKWKAFKNGIIDENGKRIRKPRSSKERDGWDILDRFCWSMKRLVTKTIGDNKLVYLFSAAYLMKEDITTIIKSDLAKYDKELEDFSASKQKVIFEIIKEMEKQNLLAESILDFETNLIKIVPKCKVIVDKYNLQSIFEAVRSETNSLEQKISLHPKVVTDFWKWFKGSKCVDEQGRPSVLYHGTDEEGFEKYVYFSTEKSFSKDYGDTIHEAYVKITNPFDSIKKSHVKKLLDRVGELYDSYDDEYYSSFEDYENSSIYGTDTWEIFERYIDRIKAMKYDGMIIYEGGVKNYVLFDNTQFRIISQMERLTESILTEDGEAPVAPVASSPATTTADIAIYTPKLLPTQRRKFNPLIIMKHSNKIQKRRNKNINFNLYK